MSVIITEESSAKIMIYSTVTLDLGKFKRPYRTRIARQHKSQKQIRGCNRGYARDSKSSASGPFEPDREKQIATYLDIARPSLHHGTSGRCRPRTVTAARPDRYVTEA